MFDLLNENEILHQNIIDAINATDPNSKTGNRIIYNHAICSLQKNIEDVFMDQKRLLQNEIGLSEMLLRFLAMDPGSPQRQWAEKTVEIAGQINKGEIIPEVEWMDSFTDTSDR